ncbi:CDP-diacylglycerol--inositol 3-phosphatidyltransferase [Paragonimus heterotremus]|uniref:CDP-diacylglycerol--inositol 3-phosphatidyltransferase n=1 Tax=Paragonimus heterotremus TaxID=100268 RepID=A0A8J4T2N6_9TREM|nr:CDP-diacylglycerol--inositol 3-phosphatidyltransferase [Paragonimus heterotremus]
MPTSKNESILLFVPNLLGYGRLILLVLSCWFMTSNWQLTAVTYFLSGIMDAFDGYAARLLNQSTQFGAMLDMLVDRCATMCLLTCLSCFYPAYVFLFQMSMLVDISSHWLHMHTSVLGGRQSHKCIDLNGNPILCLYYQNKVVLFLMCAGNELFYSCLYIRHFLSGPLIFGGGLFTLLAVLTAPVAFTKFTINVLQLGAAAVNLAGIDEATRSRKSTD